MIATISPSSGCYSETVNTLRFGQRAKLIVSCPVVNEDPKEKIIRELRTEVAKLRELLKEAQAHTVGYMLDHKSHDPHEAEIISSFYPLNQTVSESSTCLNENDYKNQEELKTINHKENENTHEPPLLHISNETLIPVMNVETSVSKDKKLIPKFRRTASVDFVGIMDDRSRTSSFGSHESLPTTKPPTTGSKILSKTSKTSKPLAASKTLSASNPTVRRLSMDKSSSLKTLLQRKSIPESPRKFEKSVETESTRTPIKPRVDSYRKTAVKPRSDIVANVTRRLYLKAKNKEASTDMEGFNEPKSEVPKELSICSNARLRLKEITQKALRAHRFKQVETQTDTVVLRVKEISTDVQDLKLYTPEVRDVQTDTPHNETVDVAVECLSIENFNDAHCQDFFKVTKTCAVQCSEDMLPSKEVKREPSPSRVSFTKYLQTQFPTIRPSIECINPNVSNPIYANSVNINVSHHYLNGKRVGSLSDDSLEDQSTSNMLFPTPDLISNHNSLDPNIHAMQNEQSRTNRELKIQYALENMENDFQISNEEIEFKLPEKKSAKIYSIADIDEKITSISLPISAYLAEICYTDKLQMCAPLHLPKTESVTATVIECKNDICYENVIVYEPTVLKSCVKVSPTLPRLENERVIIESDNSVDIIDFHGVPDSLEYHKVNRTKHVRFSPQRSKNKENMFRAMSSFLEEATILMSNISKATKNLESSNSSNIQDLDLQITIDDISMLESVFQSKLKKNNSTKHSSYHSQTQTDSLQYNHSSSQTLKPETIPHSTQDDYTVPINKFDKLLEDSCKKLEYKLNSVCRRRTRSSDDIEEYSPYPSLNSYHPSFSGISDISEDLSSESNVPSNSDYGSLNRRKQPRRPSCSPSAFLRQLTHMRKQIIESSREDVAGGNS
ncbi:hypothetical protein HHI36_002783 [Cryptolaemus montrouzieri]|uniref:Kinesin motor domain-containing protein n=1 Tax=Cryptolaemus montrouzieri TaxID=559131 RepID=A0ABD2PD16_9CUCU